MPHDTKSTRLAIPASEVPALIGCEGIDKSTIARLRRKGQWPVEFFIGQRKMCLLRDIEEFLQQRRSAAEADYAERSARGQHAINTRWSRA